MITKPPGWLYLTALSAVAGVILYWASVPHWYVVEMILVALFFGFPLYVIWVVRFGLATSRGAVDGRTGRWILPGIIAAGVMAALVVDAPFWLRFTISKPSMEAYAQTVTRQTDRDFSCQWLGLYRICDAFPYSGWEENAEEVPGSACLIGEEWAIESNTNFVLLPKGEPQETADDTYRHLTGYWYGWHGWDHW
ncbi:hypothetical protein SMD20_45680 [Nonomuraea sp. LP-02]|uniref:hypothetical protein n=1 Tax=Nonomuraea sp. LP-02 TaxID=3097960 RepID=UPI002E308FDB|nr:hypothetical protein [Nonomuraea sp. LP-02]MED7931579.1 hypothetical protein [Nonomuraea sp. LP-02]